REDERIAFALLLVEWADKDAFKLEAIAGFVLDDFLLGELHVLEPGIAVRETERPVGVLARVVNFGGMRWLLADKRHRLAIAGNGQVCWQWSTVTDSRAATRFTPHVCGGPCARGILDKKRAVVFPGDALDVKRSALLAVRGNILPVWSALMQPGAPFPWI